MLEGDASGIEFLRDSLDVVNRPGHTRRLVRAGIPGRVDEEDVPPVR
jgi:hypothetical protein